MILDYNTNLRIATMKEDFPKEDFKVTDIKDERGNITVRAMEFDSKPRYRPNLPGVA